MKVTKAERQVLVEIIQQDFMQARLEQSRAKKEQRPSQPTKTRWGALRAFIFRKRALLSRETSAKAATSGT